MRYRLGAAVLAAATILACAGCGREDEEVSIPPLSAVEDRADSGLGPGTRALSSGPGYKASPSWSPGGDRIAFTVDGYVVDKHADAEDLRRWTPKRFAAEDAEWTSGDTLAIFGRASGSAPESVYRARPRGGSPGVEEVASGVLAMSPGPGGEGLIVALEAAPRDSAVALLDAAGRVRRFYTSTVEGRASGLSPSPDGRRAVLAVRLPGKHPLFELRVMDLWEGTHRRIARLEEGLEVIGAPQWTGRGILYVAGKRGVAEGGNATALYDLYLLPPGSNKPEPPPGVGENFVGSSIRVSPDGGRLAVVGRLNPNAPSNLYVLDLETENLDDLTINERMEIKTGPDDLAWSPDGESIAIVARGVPSEKPLVRAAPADSLLEDFYNVYEVSARENPQP